MPPAPPPDLGLGKIMAIAGSLLVAIQLTRAVRAWWGRRQRAKQRAEMARTAAPPKNAESSTAPPRKD